MVSPQFYKGDNNSKIVHVFASLVNAGWMSHIFKSFLTVSQSYSDLWRGGVDVIKEPP